MLKGEGLPYSHLDLPSIKRDKKLPTVLSKKEVWQMLRSATLLKHKMLIGLLYGCGLRCMEVRSVRLKDIDFDRRMLHVVRSKGRKDRYVPLSEHLIRGLKQYIRAERPKEWLFNGKPNGQGGGDTSAALSACFDSRYSQRGVQWAVNRIAKDAGITKEVSVHTLRHTYACHLLEEGMNRQTINQFGCHAGLQLGMISILHTWGQNLSLHPHLHCIIPGGGIDKNGRWQKQVRSSKYLFSVKALSKVFRAKYVQQLRVAGVNDHSLIEGLFKTDWVVYAKRPFGGPKQVIEYLGRYTHKVAISNHRITEVINTDVSFSYKDYRDQGKQKTMQLSNREFVRRFAQHILPLRFVRIRHYGILSSTWKRGKLQALQRDLKVHRPETKVKTLLHKCPCCKTGTMITIEVFGKRGPPKEYLTEKRLVPAV